MTELWLVMDDESVYSIHQTLSSALAGAERTNKLLYGIRGGYLSKDIKEVRVERKEFDDKGIIDIWRD